MLLVEVTPSLEATLRALSVDAGVEPALVAEVTTHLNKSYDDGKSVKRGIPPGLLRRLASHLKGLGEGGADGERLLELLRGGGLIFPESVAAREATKHRDAQFAQRRQHLELAHEEREYERMTASIRGPRRDRHGPSDIQVTLKFQAAVGANMVLAGLTMFGLCYWVSKFFVSRDAHRMAAGLVGAFAITVVEMLVFVIRAGRADEARDYAARRSSAFRFGAPAAAAAAPQQHAAAAGAYTRVATEDGGDGSSGGGGGSAGRAEGVEMTPMTP